MFFSRIFVVHKIFVAISSFSLAASNFGLFSFVV